MIFKKIYIAHKCTLVNIIKILQIFALVNLHLNFFMENYDSIISIVSVFLAIIIQIRIVNL